jgi:hypothetical protein
VCNNGNDIFGAVLNNDVCGLHQRSARIGHVVDNDGGAISNISDEHHFRHLIWTSTFLVNQREWKVKAVCY